MRRLIGATAAATILATTPIAAPAVAAGEIPTAQTVSPTKWAKLKAKHRKAVAKRHRLVEYAKTRHGRGQYVAGAASAWSFDCSGFTLWVYSHVLGINLPHYSGAQAQRGKPVSTKHLRKGDLLLWGPGGSQHVSMYIGRGMMIGANNPARDVVIEPMRSGYWTPRYAGARRLVNDRLSAR